VVEGDGVATGEVGADGVGSGGARGGLDEALVATVLEGAPLGPCEVAVGAQAARPSPVVMTSAASGPRREGAQ